MELIEPPRVEQRPKLPYVGIRVVTPFRGMLKERDELLNELYGWFDGQDVAAIGPFFLRLHVVDMDGQMDIEVGAITPDPLPGRHAGARWRTTGRLVRDIDLPRSRQEGQWRVDQLGKGKRRGVRPQ